MSDRARPIKRLSAVLLAATVAACQTTGTGYDRPARIVNADDASRQSLQAAVNNAVGGSVALSDSALTDGSVLTIENLPPPTMENPSPYGRILEMPIQFRLVINGEDCILINQQDRTRHPLPEVECQAE